MASRLLFVGTESREGRQVLAKSLDFSPTTLFRKDGNKGGFSRSQIALDLIEPTRGVIIQFLEVFGRI